jgi:glutamate 5-kinase
MAASALSLNLNTIVVKIGTSSMLRNSGLDTVVLKSLASDVAALWRSGKMVSIVTSGAVGLGKQNGTGNIRLAAGRGQPEVMVHYHKLFKGHGIATAQLLLTKEDFATKDKRTQLRWIIRDGFAENTIAIINENDVVSTLETTMGDNDALAAQVACSIRADALVMLSMESSEVKGKGGGNSKLDAIELVERDGILALLVDGKRSHVLKETMNNDQIGRNNVLKLKAMART